MNVAGCFVRRVVFCVRQGPPRPGVERGACLSSGSLRVVDGLRLSSGDSRSRRQTAAYSEVKFFVDRFGEALGAHRTGPADRQRWL